MKRKGINAKAWFYSTSFVSSGYDLEPSKESQEIMAKLKESLAKLEKSEKDEQ